MTATLTPSIEVTLSQRQARNYVNRANHPAVPEVKQAVQNRLSLSYGGDVPLILDADLARKFVSEANRPTVIDGRGNTLAGLIQTALDNAGESEAPTPVEAEAVITLSFEVPVSDAKNLLTAEYAVEDFFGAAFGASVDDYDDEVKSRVKAALKRAGYDTKSQEEKAQDAAARQRYVSRSDSTAARKVLALAAQNRTEDIASYLAGEDVTV